MSAVSPATRSAAKVLLKRIKFLQDYHNIIIDLLNNSEDENGGPG